MGWSVFECCLLFVFLGGLCYLFLCGMCAFRICVLCVSADAEDMVCVLFCRLGEGGGDVCVLQVLVFMWWGD